MPARTADDLRIFVLAGASLNISAKNLTELELRYLALTAAQNKLKPKVMLRDLDHLSSDALRRLATASQGCFVFTDLEIQATNEEMTAPPNPFGM